VAVERLRVRSMKDANRNLVVRIASAAVLAPPLVWAVLCHRPEATAAVVHLAVLIALIEFYGIVMPREPRWLRVGAAAAGLGVSLLQYWLSARADLVVAALIGVTLLGATVHLVRFTDIREAATSTALTLFGILYVPLLLTSMALLKRMPDGGDWVVLTLTMTFFSDTGAYFAGRALGRHKLYPTVSPGKTVEGGVGGLLASFGAGALAKLWYMPQIGWLDAVLISIPGGVLGQVGDLVESMIKRAFGVKDSGWIIPGHGGLLDRIDALLFVSAYVYLYARYAFFG
jgi:phosphatidate cytidylyltransferase